MSSSDVTAHARVLLGKAKEDEAAVRALRDDANVADSIVGFHVQQAAEKMLKAVLTAHGAAYPWTHDIRHLMELLDGIGRPLPSQLARARRFTPWAAEFRYGETIDDPLDRRDALELIEGLREWAETEVEARSSSD